MRTVYNSSMVAHVWANRSQSTARNAQGNIHFDGDIFYSYSTAIARHVERKGRRAILVTTRNYSVTTCKHKRHVLRSIPADIPVFSVYDISAKPSESMQDYRARFAELSQRYSRARSSRPAYLASMEELVMEANEFAVFWGLKTRLFMPENLDNMVTEFREIARKEKERKERETAKRRRILEEQERQYREELARRVENWRNGSVEYPTIRTEKPLLRIRGDVVETTWGAEFPVDHARRAFRLIANCRDSGKPYTRNGHSTHLGHFTIDAIDESGNVRAGCHNVEWSEIERIARQLELIA